MLGDEFDIEDDPKVRAWREYFDAAEYLDDPYLSAITTLPIVQNKLSAALDIVESVEDDSKANRESGLAVATMAIAYGGSILSHLGFQAEGATPKPFNIEMARRSLIKLIACVDELGFPPRCATTEQIEEEESESGDPVHQVIANNEVKPVFHRETFSVEWRGKSVELGNTMSYHLFERLCKTPSQYLGINTLIQDVWNGKSISNEAVQKQVSILRKKLAGVGFEGITIDGDQPEHYRLTLD